VHAVATLTATLMTPMPHRPDSSSPLPPAAPHDPDRRAFVKTAGALAAGAGGSLWAAGPLGAEPAARGGGQPGAGREYYEWRAYHLHRGPKERVMTDYFRDALVPALRRQGTGPVGVFKAQSGPDVETLHLLIPHPTMASVAALPERLAADAAFQKAGAAVLGAPASDPPYQRIESSLFMSFAGMPRLEVPPQTAAGKPRLFELRRYESHSERASQTKIDVFNQSEIAIFRRLGFGTVFFGQALVGPRLPNLTYLLVYDDMRDHDARWAAFGADPEFKALIARPEYSDAAILSSISNTFLRPVAGSQL